MIELNNINPKVVKNNFSNLKRLDFPTLLGLLEAKNLQDKEVYPDPEFVKLVRYVLRRKQRGGATG